MANIDKLPVESNKEEENAKEANTEVIAENTDDIAIDNSKPNLETAKENSKADGNNAAEVSTSPEMCDCSISFPRSVNYHQLSSQKKEELEEKEDD